MSKVVKRDVVRFVIIASTRPGMGINIRSSSPIPVRTMQAVALLLLFSIASHGYNTVHVPILPPWSSYRYSSFIYQLARACGVPVGRRSDVRLAMTLVATINIIIYFGASVRRSSGRRSGGRLLVMT